MSPQIPKTLYKNVFALSWAIACIVIFMSYSARISVVHGSSLENIPTFATKLAEIKASTYIGNLLISFFEILLFSIVCIATGILPVSILFSFDENNLNKSTTILAMLGSSFLVGHWIYSTIFLFLAALHILTPKLVAGVLILGGMLGAYPTIKVLRLFKKKNERRLPEKDYRIIYWLSLGILFSGLLYSTSRLSYDSVGLYFSDAKITALTRGIQYFQGNSFFVSSMQTGIQYSAIIQLFGDQTARMYSWISGCIVLIFSLAIAEKVGLSSRAKGITLALLMTSTAFTDLLGDGKVDLTSSAITIAAAYWLSVNNNKAHNLFAGFLAGLAIASRPYNVFLVSVFIGTLYLQKTFYKRKDEKLFEFGLFIESMFWIGLGSSLPLALHLIENWAVFGNPLEMLADAQIMTTGNWQWAFDPQNIWLMRIMYPFVVTFLNTSQSIGNVSPIFLAFLPNIFFGGLRKKIRLSRSLTELLIAAMVTLLLWITLFFTIVEIRYIFFLWVIFFIAVSEVVVVVLENNENVFRGVLSTLLIVLLGFAILRTVYISLETYSPVDKQGNPQCKNFIFCDFLKPINDSAKPGERVLSLLAYRYYLRTDLFACSTRMDEYHILHDLSLQNPNDFWEEVYRQGYTFIAYERNYSVRHLLMKFAPSPDNTPSWLELEPIYGNPGDPVVAYKISVHEPPIRRAKTCVQNESGIWEVQMLPP